jgi:hypothetical protein
VLKIEWPLLPPSFPLLLRNVLQMRGLVDLVLSNRNLNDARAVFVQLKDNIEALDYDTLSAVASLHTSERYTRIMEVSAHIMWLAAWLAKQEACRDTVKSPCGFAESARATVALCCGSERC